MKVCDVCSKRFESINPNALRCSKECKGAVRKAYDKKKREAVIECATCGNSFIKSHGKAKTCSRSCGSKLREKNRVKPEKRRYETESELVKGINKFLLAMPT